MIWNREGKLWYSKEVIDEIVKCLTPILEDMQCLNCDGYGYDNGCIDTKCGYYQANQIMELINGL